MFVIIVVNDTIRILPQNLDKPVGDSVRDEIHAKYSNKVAALQLNGSRRGIPIGILNAASAHASLL